jgi:polyisoprenoid-binding protein YceI
VHSILTACFAASLAASPSDTLLLDTAASVIHWKGTKFWGLGKHEGTVRLANGYVVLDSGRVASARFVADMRTIEVTDIPAHEPVPRNRLRRHLMDEDFFAVERYPTATFLLRTAEWHEDDSGFRLTGDLTMRGVTHAIAIDVAVQEESSGVLRATSRFRIDRHNWGVSFRGSRLTNDLVDDDIHFTLEFVLRPRRAV